MKKICIRILSLTLCILMLVSVTPITSMAMKSGIYTYVIKSENTAVISDIDYYATGEIEIPSTIDGYTVVGIQKYAFQLISKITKVTLPETVTFIDSNAFSGSYVTEIVIKGNIETIGDEAFQWCKYLEKINLPDSVTSIGEKAFYGCESLKSINIPASLTSLGAGAFSGCSKIRSITIPEGVTKLNDETFKDCTALSEISIPDSVTEIGVDVLKETAFFETASNWDDDGFLYIGKHLISAKKAKDSRDTIEIKEGTKTIAGKAFYLSYARYVTIPSTITTIPDYAFYSSKLWGITIPSTVTSIGNYAFYGSDSLNDVIIPDTVTSIGNYAFAGCDAFDSVIIPKAVKQIGEKAFYDCYGLEKVTILSSVEVIEKSAFSNCGKLISITIPASVKSINDDAFGACKSLEDVYYEGSKDQWLEIDVGNNNDKIFSANVHYNHVAKPEASFESSDKATLTGNLIVIAGNTNIAMLLNQTKGGAVVKDKDGNSYISELTLATGQKLVLSDGTEYTLVLMGDIDGNAKITAADARLALRSAAYLQTLNDAQKKAADKSGDNKVTAADARVILRVAAGLPEKEPAKPVEPTKPALTISAEEYKYLAGTDFRSVRRDYPHAVANGAYVVAFVNADGDQCILTYVSYRIQTNWSVTTLHNITKNKTISDPERYYEKLANSAWGANKIHYMTLKAEVLEQEYVAMKGYSDVLSTGKHSGKGVFVNAKTLNL